MKYEQRGADIIIPIAVGSDWPTKESIVNEILDCQRCYGINRFLLACPIGSWRSICYPPAEEIERLAYLLLEVKQTLAPHGVQCGFWFCTTIKSGHTPDMQPIVKADGTEHPFANCPLDPVLKDKFSKNIAKVAKIVKPFCIVTEDDYSIMAASGIQGCFCKHHLAEFSRREGKKYTREELVESLQEDLELKRRWRELMKDSMQQLSKAARDELDKETPEIPMGYMQSWEADAEGNDTEAICFAMSGENHTPFTRVCGAHYHGVDTSKIPEALFHSLYTVQHCDKRIRMYNEADTYPHTRFYTSSNQMQAILSAVYSYGFVGSTFQTQQLLDNGGEERVYGLMIKREKERFNTLVETAKLCEVQGAYLPYDPFYNNQTTVINKPLWTRCVSHFGISYTSKPSYVTFMDRCQAKYYDEKTLLDMLAGCVFVDGEAAKILSERGFAKYLGVNVSESTITGMQIFDLGEREIICERFATEGQGRNMPSAHMFASSNGELLHMEKIDDGCEVVTEAYTFQKKPLGIAMTRFENELGGKVVVMGMTIADNNSQALFNYRRQRLLQQMLVWCGDKVSFIEDAPRVFLIDNLAVNSKEAGFKAMFTLINLSDDELSEIKLHLPCDRRDNSGFEIMDDNGNWQPLAYEKYDGGIIIKKPLTYLKAMCIRVI